MVFTLVGKVEDNGKGFAEFADKNLADHRFSGWGSTGIGLAFVGEVVRNHNGEVAFSNLRHGGACVTIRLPIEEGGMNDVSNLRVG